MAAVAGIFFGSNFNPPTYIQQHRCDSGANITASCLYPGASDDSLDYVFSHFCGILLSSMATLMAYTVYKGNQPDVFPEVILPAYVSGLLWAVAQVGWFIANDALGYTIAFPLVLVGPGFVGSLWDVVVFKVIRGQRNFTFLGVVFALAIASAVCIVKSKA